MPKKIRRPHQINASETSRLIMVASDASEKFEMITDGIISIGIGTRA